MTLATRGQTLPHARQRAKSRGHLAVLGWGSAGAAGRESRQRLWKMFKSIASDDKKQTTLANRRNALRGSTAICAVVVALSLSGGAKAQTVTSGTVSGVQNFGNVNVGDGSNVRIENGGELINAGASSNYIGSTAGANATMNIDAGGNWYTVSGNGSSPVRIGSGGSTGELTVNGGMQTGGTLSVGGAVGPGGTGTLNIDGGFVINDTGALRAGYSGGTGTVNVLNGGLLQTSVSSATENHIGDGTSPTDPTGTGTVNISGKNALGTSSTWTIGPQGELTVGFKTGGTGTINIKDGGSLIFNNTTTVNVGYEGGTGTMNVSGQDALFKASGGLTLGEGVGSTGTLTITDKASVDSTTNSINIGHFGGTGTLNIANGGTLNSEGGLFIGSESGSTGTLNVTNGGKIVFTDPAQALLVVGSRGTGTAIIDGPGSSVNANGYGVGVAAAGTLTVSNGGTLAADMFATIGQSGGTGTLNIVSGATATVGGVINIGWDQGTGLVNVSGAGSRIESTNNIIAIGVDTGTGTATGTLTVADGAVARAVAINVGFGAAGSGTLNIGEGQKAGIIDPATAYIAMSGASSTINFNHNEANYTFGTAINDVAGSTPVSGSVNFIGSGTTTLTAVSDYSVATNINAGKVIVASGASIANSSLTTVNSGGTLSGAGNVGNVNVASGGTIAQAVGNTLTVKDIGFAAGSIYQVGVNPGGQTGRIAANTATLNGGTVQVLAGSGNYAAGTSFTILSTTGGVTGQFADVVNTNLAFLSAGLDYADPNNVNLAIARNSTSFASVAQTQNQRATATSVGGLTAGNAIYDAVVQQDIAGARTAFDALSGEAHASGQGALINNSLIIGDTINNRLAWGFGGDPLPGAAATKAIGYAADAFTALNYADSDKKPVAKAPWMARKAPVVAPPPSVVYSLWAEGLGSWLNRSSDGNAASMKSSTAGIISGLDVTFWDTYRFGIAGGYSQSDISTGARASSLDADSYHISVYGGARQGRFGLQGGLVYSWNEIASNRSVVFPGFMDSVRADYNAATTHVFGETNYQFLVNGTALQTFAGFNYINHHTDGFAERGGAAALAVTGSDRDVVFTTLGLRSSAVLAQSGAFTLVGRGTLGWRHAFGDTDTLISAAFAGGTPFSVTGTPIATDAAYGEAGLDLSLSPAATVGVAWSGQFGNNANENRLKGQFVYRW
jgi:T5SS/PEP-CTERM-associated repeat protein